MSCTITWTSAMKVADLLRSPANEDDFFKLRKALFLAPENEEVRIQLAERYKGTSTIPAGFILRFAVADKSE